MYRSIDYPFKYDAIFMPKKLRQNKRGRQPNEKKITHIQEGETKNVDFTEYGHI